MKKNLLYAVLFFITQYAQAQYNPDAPWMKSSNQSKTSLSKSTDSPLTFNEIVSAFNAYWKNKDASKKGSGHKPFKRWENYWKIFVKEDGTLPSSKELWDTWASTQQSKQSSFKADLSNWQPIGPTDFTNTGSWSSGIGRINAIIVDPNNSNTYYAGAPAGGIWKSTNSGSSWSPLSDDLPQIGVSGIAIDHSDSDIIYIATGDDDGWDSYSVGVMKSINGGANWNPTGLNTSMSNPPTNMNDIYMHPSNPLILWVATNKGVFKTIDGGTNWDNTNGTENLNIKDIKIKPGDPNTIYAVTPDTFYVSTDAGETFTNSGFGIGLPLSSSRLVIDVTPDNTDVIYVLSALDNDFQGVYKSTDSGINFTEMAANVPVDEDLFDESKQAYYDMALAVSNNDEDEIYVGVLNIWKSINGGTDFTKVNEWHQPNSASYSHADIHLLRFYDGALFAGTDGGFYRTVDGGSNFTDLTSGMQIGQFYRLTVSKESSEKMIGGLQDNGGYAYNNNNTWLNYYGADGMDTAIKPDDPNSMYGFIQYGSSLYGSGTGGANRNLVVSIPDSEIDTDNDDYGGNWITPLTMNRDGDLYAGYESLYKLCGGYWTGISPSFGVNNNISVLEIDPINPDNIYVAIYKEWNAPINKQLKKSTDNGISFSTVYTFPSDITSIEVNNNDSNIVYVTTSGPTGGVFKSVDGGLNFNSITGSLPNITKNIIKHQNLHSQNPLFLGTSLGVYRYDDADGDWEVFENNLPTVSITDLEININDGNITAATYGRGVWQTAIPTESISDEISLETLSDIHEVVACNSTSSAKALVKNRGTNTINTITLNYSLNGNLNNTIWNGSLAPDASTVINIPSMSFSGTGLQKLKVNAIAPGDTFAGNNELITTFYSNESGSLNTVNEFESASDELVAFDDNSTCTGYWERGIPTGSLLNTTQSGNNVYGTNLSGEYGNNLKSYLVTKCYDLSILSNPFFKFYMAFDLENNWDIMYIEYTTDSGLNWQVLGTANDVNWYNSSTLPGSNCYNCPGAQWTGTDATMKEYSYNLSALNNETNIIFRFVFHSDEFTTNEGVIIDDFSIEGALSTETSLQSAFSVYPNPSHDLFNINIKHIASFNLNVTDITGKTIIKKHHIKNPNSSYKLDMTGYASGVYFLNVNSEIGTATKKLILR